MADQFDSFRKEVEEDLQRERMQKMWEQYGTYILAAAVAVVLAVAGWKYMESRRLAAAEAQAAVYTSALRAIAENKREEGHKALSTLANQAGGYGLIARLRLAASQAADGKIDEAFAAYEAIARQSGVDKVIGDYALLQAAMLKVDSAPWTDTKTRLIGMVADDNPWRHKARELIGFAAFRAGQLADARAEFEKLVADRATPSSVAERANVVMAEIIQAELAKSGAGGPATPGKDEGGRAAGLPAGSGPGSSKAEPKAAPETPGTTLKK